MALANDFYIIKINNSIEIEFCKLDNNNFFLLSPIIGKEVSIFINFHFPFKKTHIAYILLLTNFISKILFNNSGL